MSLRSELDQIRQRAENATNGPWEVEHSTFRGSGARSVRGSGLVVAFAGYESAEGQRPVVDAEFIAAARSDVPRLVAALTAVLDLADAWDSVTINPGAFYPEAGAYADGQEAAFESAADSLRAAITDHLRSDQ